MSDAPKREAPPEGLEPPKVAEEQKTAAEGAEAKIAQLEAELRTKAEEAAANFDRYLRAVADGDNLRKRMLREKAEALRLANEMLLRDLLPILDNLERAVEHSELGGNGASIVGGVQLTVRMFHDLLERHGIREVPASAGTVFDPAIHEAVVLDPNSEKPPNTVIRQEQKGYQLRDRLLRPARVAVSGPRKATEGTPEEPKD